jgi:hypothetical protein
MEDADVELVIDYEVGSVSWRSGGMSFGPNIRQSPEPSVVMPAATSPRGITDGAEFTFIEGFDDPCRRGSR